MLAPNYEVPTGSPVALPKYAGIKPSEGRIYEKILFPAGSYEIEGVSYDYDSLELPITTFVDFSRQKTVVETALVGGKGTVKELIGAEDWRITIRGVITPGSLTDEVQLDANRYPREEVSRLNELAELPISLPVVSEVFTILGIENIVIKSISLPSLDGFPSVQPFVLDCVSDAPLELFLKDNLQLR